MMKAGGKTGGKTIYEVIESYTDKHKNKVRVAGELIALTDERADELKKFVKPYKGGANEDNNA